MPVSSSAKLFLADGVDFIQIFCISVRISVRICCHTAVSTAITFATQRIKPLSRLSQWFFAADCCSAKRNNPALL
eukprot:SAG31_NODE_42614_length_270_cov_1.847953_1_plen_74_part_01